MKLLIASIVLVLALGTPLAAQITPVGPSLNLPAAGCVSINNDSFICRSIAGTFTVGTTKNGTDGKLSGSLFTPAGTLSAPPIAVGIANSGIYAPTNGYVGMTGTGAVIAAFANDGPALSLRLVGTATLGWAPSTTITSAADTTIARGGIGEITISSVAFAALGTPADGTFTYCTDCTETTAASCPVTQASCICAGSGGGAFARRVGGAWYCTF